MADKIRVLIVDDQVLFAESLSYVLARVSPAIEVSGIATDGEQAVREALDDPPDVILMDVRMPRMDGVQATMLIHSARPEVKIVMLTTFDDDEYVHSAVKNGAVGYLLKSMRPQDLVLSIQAVMTGATLFTREIAARLSGESEPAGLDPILRTLSRRELEVLGLVMEMLSNRQIAERLALSEQSVRNYVSGLYAAFGLHGRLELINALKGIWPHAER